jgi:hypothetical protein
MRPSYRSAAEPEHVDLGIVIVSLHVAMGGALGALTGSRLAALALGPPLHLACDRVPHKDIADRRFEIRSGLFGLALLALWRGPLDPATLGAASAAAPDLEHIFPRLRPHGRKLFHGGAAGIAPGACAPTFSSSWAARSSGCS